MGKKTSGSNNSPHWKSPLHHETEGFRLGFRSEVIGIALAIVAVLFAFALVSYHPADPSLNTWGQTTTTLRNYVGIIGAYGSDLLFQIFGASAFGFVFFLLFHSYLRFRRRPYEGKWWVSTLKTFGWILTVSTLLEWHRVRFQAIWSPSFAIGGAVGIILKQVVEFLLGGPGGTIALWTGLILLSLQIAEVSLSDALQSLGRKLKQLGLALGRAAKAGARRGFLWGFAHVRELLTPKPKPVSAEIPIFGVPEVKTLSIPPPPPPKNSSPKFTERKPESLESELVNLPELTKAARSVRPRIELQERTTAVVDAPFEEDQHYDIPPLEFLDSPIPAQNPNLKREMYLEKSRRLIQKLEAFHVTGSVEAICPGPVITMYEFKPKEEIKISRIANLSDDLTLALSAESVRIVAPIPGKAVVGIEIPNDDRDPVSLREVLSHSSFQESTLRIPIAIGKDIAGEPFVADLSQMPHLLVAGATGSGKSVFINTLICSILYKFTPSQLKMILIDPKMVELSVYDQIPHLLLPVVTDSQKASLALQWGVDEMERRYELLHDLQVRNIDSYNLKIQSGFEPTDSGIEHQHLPTIVIVVDELADLMMTCPKDVEVSIARLAQKARAAGIHLVLATQRPDTTVITGTIKANFSSRISFRVSSRIDSSTILDDKGAEKLLGKGDMLIRLTGMTRIARLHGAFVGESEVERIVQHVRQQGAPTYDESILKPREEPGSNIDDGELDEVYDKALDVVIRERIASISLVQRRLRIGYNRAARIIETMEHRGIIAPSDGTSRPRKVLAPPL